WFLGVWDIEYGGVHLVVGQLLVEALPAEAEEFGRGGAVAPGQLKRCTDVVAFDQSHGLTDQAAQRGLAALFDDRGQRRLQAGGAVGLRQPAPDVADQQRNELRPVRGVADR